MNLTFDPARLPACHRCGVPAIVETDRYGITHVTWQHESDCRVLRSPADRLRLDAALANATRLGEP